MAIIEGSSDAPVNIGPFGKIVGVGWASGAPSIGVDFSVQYALGQAGRFSIGFTGGHVVQTFHTNVPGPGGSTDEAWHWDVFFPPGGDVVTMTAAGPTSHDGSDNVNVSFGSASWAKSLAGFGDTSFVLVLTIDRVHGNITGVLTGTNYV